MLPGLLYVILLLVFEGGSCNDVFNCLLLATSTPDVCLGHPWDIPFPKQTGWIGTWGKSLIFWSILWLSACVVVGWIVQDSSVEQIVLVMLYAHGCVKLDDRDQTWSHVSFAKHVRASAEGGSMWAADAHFEPVSLQSRLFLEFRCAAVPFRCFFKDRILSRVTPR